MIETTLFGKTGHSSTRVLFGAAALGMMRQERADAVLETLLEFGVNHLRLRGFVRRRRVATRALAAGPP